MLIVCPSCASEYAIDPARIGPQGRSVRCARCRDAWFVAPLPAEGEVPDASVLQAEALSTEARSGRTEAELAAPPRAAPRSGRRARPGPGLHPGLARRLRPAAALLLVLFPLGLAAGAVRGREAIVRAVPATARLYERVGLGVNLRGLEFREITASLAEAAGDAALVVEGEIANVTGRPVEVPLVEIAVRERPGAPPLYTWTAPAPRDVLGPGEVARFRARLIEPPAEGREVALRFAPSPARSVVAERAP